LYVEIFLAFKGDRFSFTGLTKVIPLKQALKVAMILAVCFINYPRLNKSSIPRGIPVENDPPCCFIPLWRGQGGEDVASQTKFFFNENCAVVYAQQSGAFNVPLN